MVKFRRTPRLPVLLDVRDDIGMAQRPYPWFDPTAYQAMYRGAFPGLETNPYYTGILPRPIFHVPPVSLSPEIPHGVSPLVIPGFGVSEPFAGELHLQLWQNKWELSLS